MRINLLVLQPAFNFMSSGSGNQSQQVSRFCSCSWIPQFEAKNTTSLSYGKISKIAKLYKLKTGKIKNFLSFQNFVNLMRLFCLFCLGVWSISLFDSHYLTIFHFIICKYPSIFYWICLGNSGLMFSVFMYYKIFNKIMPCQYVFLYV